MGPQKSDESVKNFLMRGWDPETILVDFESFNFRLQSGSCNILQFANVTGPGVHLKQLEGFLACPPDILSFFSGIAIDEVLDQIGMSLLRSRNGGISIGKTLRR